MVADGPPLSTSDVKAVHETSSEVSSVEATLTGAAGVVGSVSTTAPAVFVGAAVLQPFRFCA
jgi:hypothetical protein